MIPPTLVKEFPLFGSGYFKGMDYNPEIDEIDINPLFITEKEVKAIDVRVIY